MDLNVDQFIEGLFSKEAFEQPSDTNKPEDLEMRIPEWFDKEKFNKGRRFYWYNSYQLTTSMLLGLVAVISIPSILKVLISSRRSNSTYTAYRRYLSTLLHTISWFENDLTPNSISWRSLMTVRSRHVKASLSAKLKGQGIVSQRDLALTQFGFLGFCFTKPDKFGIREMEDGDWEAYLYFWRVIGHAIGIEDKYNICRKNIKESREVCQILVNRVFAHCLENVPEYFEHMARSMLDGLWCVNPTINIEAMIYLTKYMSNVPGYVYTERDRRDLQRAIKEKLNNNSEAIGVDTSVLLSNSLIETPKSTPRVLFLHDYDALETSPAYKNLFLLGKQQLNLTAFIVQIYKWEWGRVFLNLNFRFVILLIKYFPYLAFGRFGIISSYVNIFREDPMDYETPKPNAHYHKANASLPWYKEYWSLIW